MLYVLLILVALAVGFVVLRAVKANVDKPPTRVIGPDDDPDFLWKLGRGDNGPR